MDNISIEGTVHGVVNKDTGVAHGAIEYCKTTNDYIYSNTSQDIITSILAVNDGSKGICTLELDAVVYSDSFVVSAWENINGVSICCVVDRILNPCVISWSTPTNVQPVPS
jgi:hypothetical protein